MHSFVFKWVAALCAAGLLLFSQPFTSYAAETRGSGKRPVRGDQTSTGDLQSAVDDDGEPIYRNVLRRRRPLQRDQTTTADIQGAPEEEEEEEPIYRNVLPPQRRHVSHGDAYRRGHDAGAKSRSPSADAAGDDEQHAESVYVNIPQGGIQRSRQSQGTEPQPTEEPVYAKVTRKRVPTSRGSTRAGGATGHGSWFPLQEKSSSKQLVDSSQPSGHVRPQEDDEEEEEEGEDEGEEIYGVVGLKVRGQGAEVSTTDLPPPPRQGSPEEEESVYSHTLHSRSLGRKAERAGPPLPSRPLPGEHHVYSEIRGESDRSTAPVTSGLPPTSGHPPSKAPEDAFYLKLGGKPKGESVGHATSGAPRPSAQAALWQEENEDIYSRLGAKPKSKRFPLAPSGSTQPSVQGPPAEEGASFSKIGGKPRGTEGVFAAGSGRREEAGEEDIYSEAGGAHRGKPVVSHVHVYESIDPLQNTQSRASPTADVQPAFTHVAASPSQAIAKAPEGKKTGSWMTKLKRALGVKSARKESQGSPFQTQSESPEGQEDEEGSAVYEEVGAVYEEVGSTPEPPEEEPTYAEVKFIPKVPPQHPSHKDA